MTRNAPQCEVVTVPPRGKTGKTRCHHLGLYRLHGRPVCGWHRNPLWAGHGWEFTDKDSDDDQSTGTD